MNPEHTRILELAAGWEGSAAVVSLSPADATLLESVGCPTAAGKRPGDPKTVAAPDLCAAARRLAAANHATPRAAAPTPNQQSVTGPGTDPDPNELTADALLGGHTTADPSRPAGEGEDHDEGTALEPAENLDGLTIAELKAKADAERIDITGHTRKADIVAAIQAARAASAP